MVRNLENKNKNFKFKFNFLSRKKCFIFKSLHFHFLQLRMRNFCDLLMDHRQSFLRHNIQDIRILNPIALGHLILQQRQLQQQPRRRQGLNTFCGFFKHFLCYFMIYLIKLNRFKKDSICQPSKIFNWFFENLKNLKIRNFKILNRESSISFFNSILLSLKLPIFVFIKFISKNYNLFYFKI